MAGTPYHFLISKTADGVTMPTGEKFNSVDELVLHYSRYPIGSGGEAVLLRSATVPVIFFVPAHSFRHFRRNVVSMSSV